MSVLSTLLLILTGFSLAVMVVCLRVATRSRREVKASIFPIVREEEASRMRRARMGASISGLLTVVIGTAFFVSGLIPFLLVPSGSDSPGLLARISASLTPVSDQTSEADRDAQDGGLVWLYEGEDNQLDAGEEALASQEEGEPVAQLVENAPDETQATPALPTFTPTPIPSPTPPPTLTPLPAPSATPLPSPTAEAGDPQQEPETAPNVGSAQMGPVVFATEIDGRRQAIEPSLVFPDTVERVYASFPFSGVQKGTAWTQVWYFNGLEFLRSEDSWAYGQTDTGYVFTTPVGAGKYRLELFLEGDLYASGDFEVQGPVAVGGPE